MSETERNAVFPGPTTRFVGLIGDPVVHSFSPLLHNTAFTALGLDWAYGAFTVRSGDVVTAIDGARALGFRGLSVTMPHKLDAARTAEQISPRVERLGVANTIVFEAGVAVAENTDGEGLVDDLRDVEGFDPSSKCCAVLGAGGAARAIVLSLAEAGASSVLIVNRSEVNARAAAALAPGVARVADAAALGDAALVVNATPRGMAGAHANDDVSEITRALGAGQLVVDSIYHPLSTPLLVEAARRGAKALNGLGMLAGQAALQFELWTGERAPREEMRAALRRATGAS